MSMRFAEFQKKLGFKITWDNFNHYAKRFNFGIQKAADGKNVYRDRDIILMRLVWGLTHKIKLQDDDIKLILDSITIGSYKESFKVSISPQELHRNFNKQEQELIDAKRDRDFIDKQVLSRLDEILKRSRAGDFSIKEKRQNIKGEHQSTKEKTEPGTPPVKEKRRPRKLFGR